MHLKLGKSSPFLKAPSTVSLHRHRAIVGRRGRTPLGPYAGMVTECYGLAAYVLRVSFWNVLCSSSLQYVQWGRSPPWIPGGVAAVLDKGRALTGKRSSCRVEGTCRPSRSVSCRTKVSKKREKRERGDLKMCKHLRRPGGMARAGRAAHLECIALVSRPPLLQ